MGCILTVVGFVWPHDIPWLMGLPSMVPCLVEIGLQLSSRVCSAKAVPIDAAYAVLSFLNRSTMIIQLAFLRNEDKYCRAQSGCRFWVSETLDEPEAMLSFCC